jgi:predicted RNA-binding Zn ribbon-like protein
MLRDPGDREPAPGPLRAVQAFVNTLDIENGVEELGEPEALREVLVRVAELEPEEPVTAADLARGLELREALRELLLARAAARPGPGPLAALDRVARTARFTLRFGEDGDARLAPEAPGVDGAFGRLLAICYSAMASGEWRRLKACPREVCHWVFWDQSRNLSGKWCAMSVCGNRTKTRDYRRRRAGLSVV